MTNSFDAETARKADVLAARLSRLARRFRVPTCDRDDCVQEAFLSLLKAHPEWGLDNPRTRAWLAGVVRNKALDLHRHNQRSPVTLFDDLAFAPSPNSSQALEEDDPGNLGKGVHFKLQQIITTLSHDNREIVIQRAVRDLSYREIGEPLGLTADQVKWRYHRALKNLRKLLENTNKESEHHPCMDDVGGGGN